MRTHRFRKQKKNGAMWFISGNYMGSRFWFCRISPYFGGYEFKPVCVRLNRCETALLLGRIKQLDLTVNFKLGWFEIGQSGWEVMTYTNIHRWVLPLVPNAWSYSKLGDYWEIQNQGIDALMVREHEFAVRKVLKSKQNRAQSKLGEFGDSVIDCRGWLRISCRDR